MASTIGIKLANGDFYSIVDENSEVKKRLVLTTVHDKQQSVQIDLYKSFTHTMADGLYIGSLVVEKIKPRPKGDPSIELIISSKKNGDITADAKDLDITSKGENYTLTVSLKSLDEDGLDTDIPDFELETGGPPPTGLYEKASRVQESREKKKFPWLIIICAALVAAAIGIVLWLFFFRGDNAEFAASVRQRGGRSQSSTSQPAQPPAQAEPSTTTQAAPSVPAQTAPSTPTQAAPSAPAQTAPSTPVQTAQPPVIQAPASPPPSANATVRTRPEPPVRSYRVPAVIPREGVAYRIRYGDTLWDIAEAFYRNPWLYPRIARFNNIRNPDLIISGTTIRVPPRN